MTRVQIFYSNLSDVTSKIGSRDRGLKKQLLKSLGYDDSSDNESAKWTEGINDLIDEGNLETYASQVAFNRLPQILNFPAFSPYADWGEEIYWDLVEVLTNLGSNQNLVGYLKMIYYGRRIDKTNIGVRIYIEDTDKASLNQFKDIPHHSFLNLEEVQVFSHLLKEASIKNIDDEELKRFVSIELEPALEKAKEMGKGMLVIVE